MSSRRSSVSVSRSTTEMPSLGLATNASFPSGDAVTSWGPLTVGTCPSTVPATGSTTARALASRSSTSSRASPAVCAGAAPAPARSTPAPSIAVHRIACVSARTDRSFPRYRRNAATSGETQRRAVRSVRTNDGPRSRQLQVRGNVCKSVIPCHFVLPRKYGLSRSPILFCNCRLSTPIQEEGNRLPRERPLSRTTAPLPAFATPALEEHPPPRTTVPLPGFPAPELTELPGPCVSGPLLEFPAAELDSGA